MVAADVGEDTVLICPDGGYGANVERAGHRAPQVPSWSAPPKAGIIHTPNVRTIGEVVGFLRTHGNPELQAANLVKTVLVMARSEHLQFRIAACVAGDREVNEVKLLNAVTRALGPKGPVLSMRPMTPDEVRAASDGAEPGFAGPTKGMACDVVLVDAHLQHAGKLVIGANMTDHHVLGVELARDAGIPFSWEDLSVTVGGDACPHCGKPMLARRGIEVGHVFKLGTKYSKAMAAQFLGQDQALHPFIMGCYGIGSSRVAAAAVEQHHDADGIRWPVSISPYECVVVPAKLGDAAVEAAAESLYRQLLELGIETVIDDRDAKPGVKFKDWDLIGVPFRLVLGRGVANGLAELKPRAGTVSEIPLAGAAAAVAELVRAGRRPAEARVPGAH
jgi:prolyl-tRNA synthetase